MTRNADGGFALIEVLVSSVLVVLLAIGVYAGLDSASRASAGQRSRTAAGALAEGDQQRLRALTPTVLSGLVTTPQTSTVTQNGVRYTTTSSASWIDDHAASGTCAGDVSSARYLKITSSVAWTGAGSPLKEDSFIDAPSGGGTLALQLFDRNNNGLSGITVQLTGPRTATVTTGTPGCLEWDYLPAGTYTVQFSKPGYVTPQGANAVSQTVTVADGKTNSLIFQYDQAASMDVSFYSQIGSSTYASQYDDRVTIGQSGLATPLSYGTVGNFVNTPIPTGGGTGSAPGQFPFTSSYSVYGGDCTGEDPATYGLGSDTTAKPQVTLAAGALHTPVKVRLPAVDLTVKVQTSMWSFLATATNGLPVWFARAAANGCPAATITTPARVTVTDPQRGGAGKLNDPGLPFGTYVACASAADSKGKTHYGQSSSFTLNGWTAPSVTLTIDTQTTTTSNLTVPAGC